MHQRHWLGAVVNRPVAGKQLRDFFEKLIFIHERRTFEILTADLRQLGIERGIDIVAFLGVEDICHSSEYYTGRPLHPRTLPLGDWEAILARSAFERAPMKCSG
jgi:hypothetical protein